MNVVKFETKCDDYSSSIMPQRLECNGIVEWIIRNVNHVIFVMARVLKYGKTWRFNWLVYCLGTNVRFNIPPSFHQTPY
jgi:hypothetical protein